MRSSNVDGNPRFLKLKILSVKIHVIKSTGINKEIIHNPEQIKKKSY